MSETSLLRKDGAKVEGGGVVFDFLEYLTTISDKAPQYDVTDAVLDYFMSLVFAKYHLTNSGELKPKEKNGDRLDFSLRDAYLIVYPWYRKLTEEKQRKFVLGAVAFLNTTGLWDLYTKKEAGNCSYRYGNALVDELASHMFEYVAEVVRNGWLLTSTFDFMKKTYAKQLLNWKDF